MIRAIYSERELRMIALGHAGAGEPGHDLVCAAVSTLMLTLASALERRGIILEEERLESGEADVAVDLNELDMDTLSDCRLIFGTVSSGMEMLGESFPRYLEYRVVENTESKRIE